MRLISTNSVVSCFLLLLLTLVGTHELHAGPQSADTIAFESLKSRYMKLRNTDRDIQKEAVWRAVLKDLDNYAKQNPRSQTAAVALFNAATMEEQFYLVKGDESALDSCIERLQMLESKYPNHELADDALIKAADLLHSAKNDLVKAKALYQAVRSYHKNGDMYDVAKVRLANISNGQTPSVKPDASEQLSGSHRKVVVLDPGHGGEDLGAVGVGQLFEKDVTLDIAFQVKDILEKEYNYKVVLTRERDEFVPLMDRTMLANNEEADIFVSLHVNASVAGNIDGAETYYLDNTGDKASHTLAERENASVQYEGADADVRYMLSDLVQNLKLDDSVSLAKSVQSALVQRMSEAKLPVKNLGVKKAPFYVLVGAHMPCILVEMSFIDHSLEGVRLGDKNYRKNLARGVAQGLRNYLELKK